jgi:hypothetical protein
MLGTLIDLPNMKSANWDFLSADAAFSAFAVQTPLNFRPDIYGCRSKAIE